MFFALAKKEDCLSQWRGYADDGRGCCIGFSKDEIKRFCDLTNGVLQFQVLYVTEDQINEHIVGLADKILDMLKILQDWIIENMTHNDADPNTEGLLWYNFDGMIESAFTDSLRFKAQPFSEETEWRIFFANQAYKKPQWVYKKQERLLGPSLFDETLDFLNNRIDFWWTNNDLIPYCPLRFEEFSSMPIKEILIGPKNNMRKSDLELFLHKYEYSDIDIDVSRITYR